MILHVIDAEYRGDYRIWIRFNDGADGVTDLADELNGPMFEPLRDLEAFKRFRVDEELRTIVWDNGADLAPEFLHKLISSGRQSHLRVVRKGRTGNAGSPAHSTRPKDRTNR